MMQPGLVVKLRPAGPWRIGPDSGARNRVDFIYHSDSMYSAVTGAMLRMGSLDEWLTATARAEAPAVCFSSCFPFMDEIGFIVPPRSIWPPAATALLSGRVRWKSARFVPLGIVQALLAGQTLDENHWTVDGPSECLVPAGRHGPFRTATRWSASVDRMTGASERHSTACLEFRPGAGWWMVVSFRDDGARARWNEPVRAALRLLADTGFGGEKSRGWGHAEVPEFIEGSLPQMIMGESAKAEPRRAEPASSPEPTHAAAPEPAAGTVPEPPVKEPEPDPEPQRDPEPAPTPEVDPTPNPDVVPPPDPDLPDAAVSAPPAVEPLVAEPQPQPGTAGHPHWLLSLFTPALSDQVDWTRGNYSVLARGGRVDSPAGSGELKKQLNMVAEGSVLFSPSAPRGSAADVAPEGFAHPVFRAGFAVAMPLPEVG
jgi:CRISPR type III-A-associated RAMP protein Csm4